MFDKEIAKVLAIVLGVPLAVVGYLAGVWLVLGKWAFLGALVTLDVLLVAGVVFAVVRHFAQKRADERAWANHLAQSAYIFD